MIIYKATKKEFIKDFETEKVIEEVEKSYKEKVKSPDYGMINSWNGSIPYLYLLLNDSSIPDDCGISIEHTIPNIDNKKRIDVLITGKNKDKQNVVIVIEMKQWSKVQQPSDKVGYLVTSNSKKEKLRPHPSFQADSYCYFLKTYNGAFVDNDIQTYACAFLHNYNPKDKDVLYDEKYKKFIEKCPIFLRGDLEKLREFINQRICEGDNCKIIDMIDNSHASITKLLTPNTVDIMKNTEYIALIDEQQIAYEKAIEMAKQSIKDGKKRVFIVKGGPGTGKSVLAMKLFVDISMNSNKEIKKVSYITPIQAQKKVYKYVLKKDKIYKQIKENIKGSGEFTNAIKNDNNILIVDESHRLKEKSGMYGNKGENQTKEIIKSSKFTIFFIDDLQRITLKDKGSTEEITRIAKGQHALVEQFELTSQFRCSGSTSYISWIEDVLQIRNTANHDEIDSDLQYDVQIVDDPNEMRKIIRKKNKKHNSARIVAGYCWNSKKESRNNPNMYDIKIPKYNFYMSWNLEKEPWAVAEDSVERAGCIYTCHGLDFEYVGVIIGPDMIYRDGKIEVDYTKRAKTDNACTGLKSIKKKNEQEGKKLEEEIIKNTYRILLTRGKVGCIIYCEDEGLREYLKERLERVKGIKREKENC